MRRLGPTLATLSLLATTPFWTACGPSSLPLIKTQVERVLPPSELMADLPPPELPARFKDQDAKDRLTLDLAAWGAALRSRLVCLRAWANGSAPCSGFKP